MEYALVLLWLVAFQALALVALPLVARLFPRFPDRGAAFALPVALVVVTTVVYWVGHLAFGRWTAFLGVAVLAGLSLVVLRRDRTGDVVNRDATKSTLVRPRGYAEAAAVFTVAFCFLVAVRAVDPALVPGGGEKFLDFGIYKSLLRANALPPQDMWWAGDHVLYYYGGHLVAATVTSLTGTAPRYAYNLALSGFYASLVTAAYGLAAAMADARGASRATGGVLGAFFVGFASNLVAPVTGLLWLLPDSVAVGVADWVARQLRSSSGDPSLAAELVGEGLDAFGYWAPSRVIPNTINEFPLFAFLNGDLHGHMLSTQFLLLIAALGFAYYATPPGRLRRRRALAFGALPPVVALLALVNVWSFPTGLGVTWLALLFAPADPLSLFPGVAATDRTTARDRTTGEDPEPRRTESDGGAASAGTLLSAEFRRLAGAFAATGVVAVATVVWMLPFVLAILLQSATNRSLAFFPTQSSAAGLLLVHGLFLLVFALYLWPRARESFDVDTARFGLLAAAILLLAWRLDYPVLALVVPLLILGWLLLRTDEVRTGGGRRIGDGGRIGGDRETGDDGGTGDEPTGVVGYETVLLVAGAGLVTLVEFVYVNDSAIGGRFNTVFKVYMQVWVLWAPAAGAALAVLLHRTAGTAGWTLPSTNVSRSDVMAGLAALLVVSSGLYGVLALQNQFTADGDIARTDDPTLNGMAYLDARHPDEAEAIRWINDRDGQPHVATAPGRQPYSWSSPVPSLTGVPAVIGWVYQEGVYRGREVADNRAEDVDLLYRGQWSDRAELLKQYDVQYIYVGPLEREQYPNADLDFADEPGIEVAERADDVVIYRVDHSQL